MLGCEVCREDKSGKKSVAGGDLMSPANVVRFPVRNPELFSAEINSQIMGNDLYQVLYATIRALPYVQDRQRQEELKQALCELLLSDSAA
jgi:hypothetical protein